MYALLVLTFCGIAVVLTWLLYQEIQHQRHPQRARAASKRAPVPVSFLQQPHPSAVRRSSPPTVASPSAKPTPPVPSTLPAEFKAKAAAPSAKPVRPARQPSRSYPKLVRLLNGDRTAADRLVQAMLLKHPDRSEDWCYEKVVFDLERDRGR